MNKVSKSACHDLRVQLINKVFRMIEKINKNDGPNLANVVFDPYSDKQERLNTAFLHQLGSSERWNSLFYSAVTIEKGAGHG